jgi:hypothetical protein
MNFKEWIKITERAGTTRQRPTSIDVVDRGSLYGAAAQFGRTSTQTPFAAGWNNQAVSSLIAGVGAGTNKALAATGYEPSPAPQINELPSTNKSIVEKGSLPLQLPLILALGRDGYLPGFRFDKIQSYDSDISKQVYSHVKDPENDPRVRTADNNSPNDKDKFATLEQIGKNNTQGLYGIAKNFTRALIKISVINKMYEKGLDKKYNLSKGKLGKEVESDGNLICAFYFEPYETVDQEEVKE